MDCPICSSDTEVRRTRASTDGTRVTRTRYCREDPLHRFDTVEQLAGYRLDAVRIRRSGDQRLAQEPFSKARIVKDVRGCVVKRLNDSQIYEAVNAAVHDLETDLGTLVTPLNSDEQQTYPGCLGAIPDTAITDAVERHLRQSPSRIAHVLYALAIRGRSDSAGRPGWSDASHVLHWLGEDHNYPELATPMPTPMPTERISEEWSVPPSPPRPSSVIKRDGDIVSFRMEDKFDASIKLALLGRTDVKIRSHAVERWVLWGLHGQRQVTAAQLGVGVLDALRRIDDIAYLRWAIIHKRIDSVATFVDEVRGLIEHPSPHLDLRPTRTRPDLVRSGG